MNALFRTAMAGLLAGLLSAAAWAAPTTQMGFLIDASGSIGTPNFNIMRTGYHNAVAALPTDGSVELTIYTFATGTVQVVAPTVITAANLNAVLNQITAMVYTEGSTATNLGITAIATAMRNSTNYAPSLRSIINIATDGAPNNPATAITAAANARNVLGMDAMTAEAIGAAASGADFLRDLVFSPLAGPCNNCGVLLADGATPPNPMTSQPWVLPVNSFDDFGRVLNAKVQAVVNPNPVPEPASIAMVLAALGALTVVRRRAR